MQTVAVGLTSCIRPNRQQHFESHDEGWIEIPWLALPSAGYRFLCSKWLVDWVDIPFLPHVFEDFSLPEMDGRARPLLCPRPFSLLEMDGCFGGYRSSFVLCVNKHAMMDVYLDQYTTALLLGLCGCGGLLSLVEGRG